MKYKGHFFLWALLLIVPVPVHAGDGPWIEVNSPHFTVLTDAGEKKGRQTALQFEKMRAVFARVLPSLDDSGQPALLVYAPRNREEYKQVQPAAFLGKGKARRGGQFLSRNFANYITVQMDTKETFSYETIYHEYTHYLIRKQSSLMPLWLQEGLADFYQSTTISDSAALIGRPNWDFVSFLRNHWGIYLRDLMMIGVIIYLTNHPSPSILGSCKALRLSRKPSSTSPTLTTASATWLLTAGLMA